MFSFFGNESKQELEYSKSIEQELRQKCLDQEIEIKHLKEKVVKQNSQVVELEIVLKEEMEQNNINQLQVKHQVNIGNLKFNIICGFLMNPNIHLTHWFDRFIEMLLSGSYTFEDKTYGYILKNPSDESRTILYDRLEKKMIRPGKSIENYISSTDDLLPKKLIKSIDLDIFRYPGYETISFKMNIYPFFDATNWKNDVNHFMNNTGTSQQQQNGSDVWCKLLCNPELLSSYEMVENIKLWIKKYNYSVYHIISSYADVWPFIRDPRFKSFITEIDIQKLKEDRNGHRNFSMLDVIDILEKNPELIEWHGLSQNPYAIPLIEKNPDKINWETLAKNPNGLHLFEPYLFILL